jgi:hypothetical protein
MELAVLLALAAGLSFVLGLVVGARRMSALYRQGRVLGRVSAVVGRLAAEFPRRSSADMMAGVVRITLAGFPYELPVLSRAESRAWLVSLDARFAATAALVEAADAEPDALVPLLIAEVDAMADLLKSYDVHGILPPRSAFDDASDSEILRAMVEVVQAANPKAATSGPDPVTPSGPPERPSSSPRPTAGPLRTSSG